MHRSGFAGSLARARHAFYGCAAFRDKKHEFSGIVTGEFRDDAWSFFV
jgi:hypothetical protein